MALPDAGDPRPGRAHHGAADNDDTQDEHPWEWLAELLHVHGIDATAEELRLLPYDVVFSERLRARVMTDA